jgi:hypothetical protein
VAGDSITNLPAWAAASHMQLGQGAAAAQALETFLRLARANWTGGDAPDAMEAVDWFMGCFPIRSDAVAAELRTMLLGALQEQKKRRP